MAWGDAVNGNLISRQVEEYVAYKKGLGYQIRIESQELRRFAAYTITEGYEGSLTAEIAYRWATLKPDYSRWYMARRLETVRTFAKYIRVFDSNAQLSPKGVFGKCHGRTTPFIFTEEDVCNLMKTAGRLHSPDGLRCRTIPTAIGLLWSTGMRPSEAIHLMDHDVDLDCGMLTIRETKFAKSRILPLHPSTVSQLKAYVEDRDKLRKDGLDRHFLIVTGSRGLELRNLEYAFNICRNGLMKEAMRPDWRAPRLYDIRHSFACNTLLNWHKSGQDIEGRMLSLSTYLGHVKLSDTYWYLTGTPELMRIASERFESYVTGNGGFGHEEP